MAGLEIAKLHDYSVASPLRLAGAEDIIFKFIVNGQQQQEKLDQ